MWPRLLGPAPALTQWVSHAYCIGPHGAGNRIEARGLELIFQKVLQSPCGSLGITIS